MLRDFIKNKYVKLTAAAITLAVLVLLSVFTHAVPADDSGNEYITALETKLAAHISEISGVYGVSVMLTAEESPPAVRTGMLFSDSAASARAQTTHGIKGAAVVCGGADDPLVKEKVVEYVSKVLGIGASRVCVVS